jgi:hypothetical protein
MPPILNLLILPNNSKSAYSLGMYRWNQGIGQVGGPLPPQSSDTHQQFCALQTLKQIEAYESNVRAGAQAPGLQTINFTCHDWTGQFPDMPVSVPNTSEEIAQLNAVLSPTEQFSPAMVTSFQPGQKPTVSSNFSTANMNPVPLPNAAAPSSQNVISSSSVPGTPPIQAGSSAVAQASGFDFSAIPWWAWLAGAGAAVFAFSKS